MRAKGLYRTVFHLEDVTLLHLTNYPFCSAADYPDMRTCVKTAIVVVQSCRNKANNSLT